MQQVWEQQVQQVCEDGGVCTRCALEHAGGDGGVGMRWSTPAGMRWSTPAGMRWEHAGARSAQGNDSYGQRWSTPAGRVHVPARRCRPAGRPGREVPAAADGQFSGGGGGLGRVRARTAHSHAQHARARASASLIFEQAVVLSSEPPCSKYGPDKRNNPNTPVPASTEAAAAERQGARTALQPEQVQRHQ